MKKIIALILVVVSLFSVMSISVYADNTNENTVTVTVNKVTFVFDANTTEEIRDEFITHYFNHNDDSAATYGLTCTLLGHKLETSYVMAITHEAKATDPRCLEETFEMQACSRCDYFTRSLVSATYISCC